MWRALDQQGTVPPAYDSTAAPSKTQFDMRLSTWTAADVRLGRLGSGSSVASALPVSHAELSPRIEAERAARQAAEREEQQVPRAFMPSLPAARAGVWGVNLVMGTARTKRFAHPP